MLSGKDHAGQIRKQDYSEFYTEAVRYLAAHPEYVDRMIQNMQLNGVRGPDERAKSNL